jgi:hypothetical protein
MVPRSLKTEPREEFLGTELACLALSPVLRSHRPIHHRIGMGGYIPLSPRSFAEKMIIY